MIISRYWRAVKNENVSVSSQKRSIISSLSKSRRVAYDLRMGDEGKPDPGTDRKACTLAIETIRYLEALAKKGTHGSGVSKVMTTLIEQGVRQAIREGFIKQFEKD
jgi:hypothetical protein